MKKFLLGIVLALTATPAFAADDCWSDPANKRGIYKESVECVYTKKPVILGVQSIDAYEEMDFKGSKKIFYLFAPTISNWTSIRSTISSLYGPETMRVSQTGVIFTRWQVGTNSQISVGFEKNKKLKLMILPISE